MLYLVHKTNPPLTESPSKALHATPNPQEALKKQYLWGMQKISENLFSFFANDTRYQLKCSFLLDIQELYFQEGSGETPIEGLRRIAVCSSPVIDDQGLAEKSFGNDYIQENLRLQFYLNILESLFLFCEDVTVDGLSISITHPNPDLIKAYQDFIISQTHTIGENGEEIRAMILTDIDTYDKLIDFTEKVNQDFQQALWRKQWGNPAIRDYLKSHALSVS